MTSPKALVPVVLALSVVLVSVPVTAHAQNKATATQYVPQAETKDVGDREPTWDYTLGLSANFALAQNSNMVGQPEGMSYLIGLGAVGTLSYVSGRHEVKSTLALVESFSKTPVLDRVVKANDLARLEGLYSYYFLNWLGAFGRLSFESPLLTTEDVRSDPVDYNITRLNGSVDTVLGAKSLRLASGFQPLSLYQSLGLVARPVNSDPALVTFRVGAGFRETLADGVLINKDDKATVPIELFETATVLQGGLEVALGITGKFPEQRLTYGLDLVALMPFINNDALNRPVGELTRLGLSGNITFSMFEWLGLNYQLLVARDLQLVSGIQVQNNLFLTFKYDIIPAKKAVVVDPLAEAQAAREAAEKRALEAEIRAKAAETRVQELQQTPPAPTPAPTKTP
jgi:hypothetical protein